MIPITYALPLPLSLSFIPLNKCPAFNSFYNKVLARGQGFIGVRAARLSPSLVQVTVQPQTKLSTARKKDRIRGDTVNMDPLQILTLQIRWTDSRGCP